ncbi:hypothetical protein Tco_0856119 [Tanacetum coccineum]
MAKGKDLIFLSSDSSTNKDMNDGPSVAKVPKEDNSIKDDYASDVSDSPKSKSKGNNLPVGKKASHKVIKNKNAEDTSCSLGSFCVSSPSPNHLPNQPYLTPSVCPPLPPAVDVLLLVPLLTPSV